MGTKKVLITGASGFIGSFLVETALLNNFETWAGVRKSSSKQYLKDPRIKFVDFNYSNKEVLKTQLLEFKNNFGKFDYIVHNAGITKSLKSSDFHKVNYQYTVNFIDALKEADCVPDKFVLMSSLSAFGMWDEKTYRPLTVNDSPAPNTIYGNSKLLAEKYLQAQNDFPYIILRPTGVYGPREKDYFLMVKTMKLGFNVGAGYRKQNLTFIYVQDLANVVFLALNSSIANASYFVSDGDVYTSQEYTSLVQKVIGKNKVLKITIPLCILKLVSMLSEFVSRITKQPSTLNRDKYVIMKQRNWNCDIEPLIQDLGFKPTYNLERGLKESVKWYKENGWLK